MNATDKIIILMKRFTGYNIDLMVNMKSALFIGADVSEYNSMYIW